MVIFSKNKRNAEKKMEKIVVCTKMMLEKNVCGDVYVYKKITVCIRKFLIPPFRKMMVRP